MDNSSENIQYANLNDLERSGNLRDTSEFGTGDLISLVVKQRSDSGKNFNEEPRLILADFKNVVNRSTS